tara:strand:- start:185 stop:781 length:597 start_codon:yes stop_codon:yes gene_type:complete
MQLFDRYHDFILKEQKKMNLIGKGTLEDVWSRHFANSAPLIKMIKTENYEKRNKKLIDIGSGAGLPGLVVAIFFKEIKQNIKIYLAESNQKKCMFLKKIICALELEVEVINNRAELIKDHKFDFITARAVAPLEKLLKIIGPINNNSQLFLFKGKNWKNEYNIIKKKWMFKSLIVKKNDDYDKSGGVILIINGLKVRK